jgi:hypothetical protein
VSAPSHPSTDDAPRYWFRAKRYGWGWGVPLTWQGWVLLVAYLAVVLVPLFLGSVGVWVSLAAVVIATPLLMWVCTRKGEPPQWSWGGRHD